MNPFIKNSRETQGAVLALLSAVLWGVFPVMVNRGSHYLPPLLFAALSTFFAAAVSLGYTALKGKLHELRNRESYTSLFMITLCIVIIPYTLFFIGAGKTSGLNTSLLLLSEIIFTLVFTPFIGEKTTIEKLIGALGVFCGAVLILYRGSLQMNTGDILVIMSTATYPVGNFYAKKALTQVSPSVILLVRFFLGGFFLLLLSIFVEGKPSIINTAIVTHWPLLVLTGFILLGAGKLVWYEALDRLDISKAISLSMTFPLFSLIIVTGFYKESISRQQAIGIAVMMVGVFFSAKRPSVDPARTKYRR
jgi:drug/metabolite transporter (DMT)-like permease